MGPHAGPPALDPQGYWSDLQARGSVWALGPAARCFSVTRRLVSSLGNSSQAQLSEKAAPRRRSSPLLSTVHTSHHIAAATDTAARDATLTPTWEGGRLNRKCSGTGTAAYTWRCPGWRWVTTSARARHTSDEHASDNQRVRDDERRMRCAIVRSRAACLSWNALPPVGTHERLVRNRSRTRCAPTMERSPPGGAFTHLVRLRSSSQQSPHPGARGLVLLTPSPTAPVWCHRPQRAD